MTIQRACFYCGDVFRVIEHPVIASWTDRLRSVDTDTDEFRRLLRQIGQLLVPSATEHLPTREITVHTPLAETTGRQLDGDTPVLVFDIASWQWITRRSVAGSIGRRR